MANRARGPKGPPPEEVLPEAEEAPRRRGRPRAGPEGPLPGDEAHGALQRAQEAIRWKRRTHAGWERTCLQWGLSRDLLERVYLDMRERDGLWAEDDGHEAQPDDTFTMGLPTEDGEPEGDDDFTLSNAGTIEDEIEAALAEDRVTYLEDRIRLAIFSKRIALKKGNHNTAKNWEQVINRLRDALDRQREVDMRKKEAAGDVASVDAGDLARRVLRNLPQICAVAPLDAMVALEKMAQLLGRELVPLESGGPPDDAS